MGKGFKEVISGLLGQNKCLRGIYSVCPWIRDDQQINNGEENNGNGSARNQEQVGLRKLKGNTVDFILHKVF